MSTISLADARSKFSQLIDSAATTHERFEITKNGERVALLIGADDYDAMIETFEILADRELTREVFESIKELREGRTYSSDELREAMRAAGRLNG
jgi:antitoxin YefM